VLGAGGQHGVLDVGATVHLGDEHPLALRDAQRPDRRGDGRLADPALAGDEDEPVIEEADYSSPSQ
jgi:hypothetical protein